MSDLINHGQILGETEVMIEKFDELRLPEIYIRNGKECYLDPIRKKLIYITPEETVRQRMISYLIDVLKVPEKMILVEEHLSHYGIDTKRRADIVIHAVDDEDMENPIAVIECKAPEIYLDEKAGNQMLDYSNMLCVDYAMMVNGVSDLCYKYDEKANDYIRIESLPIYADMIAGKYVEFDAGECPKRMPFYEIEPYLKETFASRDEQDIGSDISKYTPLSIAVPVFNLYDGLLDERIRIKPGDFGMFRIVEDYGVRLLSYGNAGGGQYFGPYRSFLVDVAGNTEFYSIGLNTYYTGGHIENAKTCICVAHDDEKESHHSLQLVADDNLEVNGDMVAFYHHGRIAVGKKGSGKIDELRALVKERAPELIKGNKFYLGSIKNDRLWTLEDEDVVNVVVSMIKYAMIRDEYRERVKRER